MDDHRINSGEPTNRKKQLHVLLFNDQCTTKGSVRIVQHAPHSPVRPAGKTRQAHCEPTPKTTKQTRSTKVVLASPMLHETTVAAPVTCTRFNTCEPLADAPHTLARRSFPERHFPQNSKPVAHTTQLVLAITIRELWRTHMILTQRAISSTSPSTPCILA